MTTDYKTLRGDELRRANDEYFAHGTGPRARYEAQLAVDAMFWEIIEANFEDARPCRSVA